MVCMYEVFSNQAHVSDSIHSDIILDCYNDVDEVLRKGRNCLILPLVNNPSETGFGL